MVKITKLSKDFLQNLYWKEKLSTYKIAEKVGILQSKILCAMKEVDIPRRTRSEARRLCGFRKFSDSARKNIANGTRKSWRNPEYRKKVSEAIRKNAFRGKKRVELTKSYWKRKGYREKMSKILVERWKNEEFRNKTLRAMFLSRKVKPTKPERKFISIVKKYKLPFKYVGDGKIIINGFCPDFIDCDGSKRIIEIFGDYWHNPKLNKNVRTHELEPNRKAIFAEYGFKTLVIWESELNTLSEEEILRKISEW